MLKLWKYSIARLKNTVKNYNVVQKAEKVLETEKRAAPRHPGTEVKFQVLIKGNPGLKEELLKKDRELMNRLKIVKVNSASAEEEAYTSQRPLPQERQHLDLPQFGYQEPSIIPEGRCTLKQALEFLAKHQNDPQTHTVEAIAETYSLKKEDVQNILTHFRAFELFVSRDSKNDPSQDVLDQLGVGKVVKPLFRAKFAHLNEKITGDKGNVEEKVDSVKEVVDEKK